MTAMPKPSRAAQAENERILQAAMDPDPETPGARLYVDVLAGNMNAGNTAVEGLAPPTADQTRELDA
jgi:hypothetical protein